MPCLGPVIRTPTSDYTFDEFSLGEKGYHEAEFDEQSFQNSISYVTTKSADLRKASKDKRQMNRPELVTLTVKYCMTSNDSTIVHLVCLIIETEEVKLADFDVSYGIMKLSSVRTNAKLWRFRNH